MKYTLSLVLIILFLAILAHRAVVADQTWDPGYDDISIQPIGASIKRCQFSDKEASSEIKGFKVPNSIDNPAVTFEQYRMGDAKDGPACTVPMLRGRRENSSGVSMPVTCFFEMNCSS